MIRIPIFVAALLLAAAVASAQPAFDVASIRKVDQGASPGPSRTRGAVFSMASVTVAGLAGFAYDVPAYRVVGGPDWVRQDRFAVEARAGMEVPVEQMRTMVQSLLGDRFGLRVHREPREIRHFVLASSPDGRPGSSITPCVSPTKPVRSLPPQGAASFVGPCADLSALAAFLTNFLQTPVIDRSGLRGTWDYRLVFVDPRQAAPASPQPIPGLETALREQLGLTLDAGRGPIDALVIDAVHPPTEN